MVHKRKTRARFLELAAMVTALSALLAAAAPIEPMPAKNLIQTTVQMTAVQAAVDLLETSDLPEDAILTAKAVLENDPELLPESVKLSATPVLPESPAVENSFFADAVFLGDSRTEGFHLYSGLKEGAYFYSVGATVESVFTKPVWKTASGKVPLLDAMKSASGSQIYIMLGVNELGWPRNEQFKNQYAKLIDRIRADRPEADIIIESILPVSARQDAKGSYVNNHRINQFNDILLELAEEKDCLYLDVAECVSGADGCLKADLTFDGVHLNPAGCRLWLDYLKTHTA